MGPGQWDSLLPLLIIILVTVVSATRQEKAKRFDKKGNQSFINVDNMIVHIEKNLKPKNSELISEFIYTR